MTIFKINGNIPGQASVLHASNCWLSPTHAWPPCWGAGLSHIRLRVRTPTPQEWLHPVHSVQLLQSPFTGSDNGVFDLTLHVPFCSVNWKSCQCILQDIPTVLEVVNSTRFILTDRLCSFDGLFNPCHTRVVSLERSNSVLKIADRRGVRCAVAQNELCLRCAIAQNAMRRW